MQKNMNVDERDSRNEKLFAAFVFPVFALIGIINVVGIGKRVLYSIDRVKKYIKDIFLIKVLALTS